MRIRKQVYDLTIEDFEQHPIWEFALDEEGEEGQDEATVRPYSLPGPADASEGMAVVKASFILADGTQMFGFLTPPTTLDAGGLGTIQPQIITPQGQVSFWYGVLEPTQEHLKKSYERLGRDAKEVFPVRFKSEVEVVGGPVTGTLNGFLYMEMENERIHEIR